MIWCFASWLKYLQQTDWIDRDCPGLVVRCGAMCGVSWSGVYTPTWSTLDPNPSTSSSWCSEVSNYNAGVFYSVGGWRDMVATARVSVVTHNAPALCPGILIYRLFRALAQLYIALLQLHALKQLCTCVWSYISQTTLTKTVLHMLI